MATFYGGWVATDDFRAILDATVSNTSDTQCTVKLVLKIQSNYAYAGSSGRASVTCNGTTRSDNVSYDAGKTTTLMTESFTVARGSSSKSISVSGKVWQVNSSSAYAKGSTASGKVTIPAIDYDAPNAPSSCSASRASDTSAKVTWKNGGTSTLKPRSSTKVERQTDGGSWVQVASVGASTTSYTDNSISANHRYRYRVRAQGAGGYSGYSTSGYIYTTPAAPASVTASVTQGTSVRIAVDGANAPWAESWEVQSSLNGGEWTAVGTYTSFPATADIGGGTVRLRARSLRGPLASAWTESTEITTITPPLAPTVTVTPSGVAPTGTAVTVSWTPNHPDGSDQTQAQVEYTVGDGSPTTADVTGAATSYRLPSTATESPATVSVRVRTHGADEEWGAWSGPVTMTVAEPPSVAITSPGTDGAVVADLPLDVEWTVFDSTGVASQTLALLDGTGRTLHTAQLAASARSYTLDASTYLLSNSSDYTLRLTVTGGSSLTASEERDFRTSFAEPSAPTVDAEADHSDMSVSLTVHAGPSSTDAGAVVTVTDHAPAGTPVPGFTVYGNTRQNLWVNPSGTNVGVTVTSNEDGSITVEGTATQRAVINLKSYALRAGSSYTVSSDKKMSDSWTAGQAGSGAGFGVVYRDSAGAYQGQALFGYGDVLTKSFAVPSTAAYVEFYVIVEEGQAVSGTYRVMLNEGSEAEPWCPPGLSSIDELSVVTAGKNLAGGVQDRAGNSGCNWEVLENGLVHVSGTPTLTSTNTIINPNMPATMDASLFIGKTMTVKSGLASGSIPSGARYQFIVRSFDASGIQISDCISTNGSAVSFQVKSNTKTLGWYFVVSGLTIGTPFDAVLTGQLELGSTATAYEPPAVTTTPIDLDGNTLNSLPDGTCDELRIDGTGAVTVERHVGNIASYGGEEVGEIWLASALNADGTPATGAHVIYLLAEPQTVELPGVTLPSWPDGPASLWASAPVPTEMRVDYPDVSSLTVQRVNADGTTWVVGDGLADGDTVVDPLPPLNVPTDYVITAHTAAGATSELRITETLQALVGAFNFGQAAGLCELAELNPDWSHDVARSGTLYHFADGGEGGGLPVAYGGQDVDATRSMGFTLLDLDQLRRLQELAREHFVCWYRDPYGGRALCAVSWSFSSGIPYGKLDVSASMTETVFEEAW